MGLGQTLLGVAALALLGTAILMMNNSVLDSGSAIEMTEYVIMATSLGISQVESASGKAFDENTVDSDVGSISSLSATLRSDGSETEATFDDYDDYNGFTKWVNGDTVNFRSANFFIRDSVDYVTISGNAIVSSASRTYHKRLRVWVSSPFMRDTLTFSSVYSYWYFR
jgi:hypothetical protein